MPRRARRNAGRTPRGWPSNTTSPLVGVNVPLIMPMIVDLPAPLGPISPRISPRFREKFTSPTAVSPPKRMVNSLTRRMSSMSASEPVGAYVGAEVVPAQLANVPPQVGQPARHQHHGHH